MRIAHLLGLAVAVVLQLVLLSSCTTPLPATVTRAPVSPLKSNPKIFVRAAAQRERIVESLRNAGLEAMNSSSGPDYTLEVRVGRSRRSTPCGGISTVAFVLSHEGRYVLVIKGRGLTGSCRPNIFDDMSHKLSSYVGS